jgi:hypothetical protein
MSATVLLAPVASREYVTTSGAVYLSDKNQLIVSTTMSSQDRDDLKAAGCFVLTPPPTDLLGYIKSANFNATADQAVNLLINAKYRIRRITALNTSVNGMSTAVGGVYTAAAKGGSAIVANTQAYTGLTNALTALDLTLALPNLVLAAGTPLYLSLTTAQGAPATADIAVYGDTFTF